MLPVTAAQWLADQKIHVLPVWGTTPEGICRCPAGAECTDKPGKHPVGYLATHGYHSATTDIKKIRKWWKDEPDAGVAIALAASGLVDISSDSPEWLTVFQQRGLPETAAYQSPGGEGHVHFLFRRPKGCPTTRINRSGEYDIQSDGYSVAPPTQGKEGRIYDWMTPSPNLNGRLPDAPAWAVEMLKEAAQKKARPAQSTTEDAADEPPVELSDHDLAVWLGTRPKLRKGSTEVDRSASLMAIGRVLYDAGMTRRGVVSELAERDHALNWHKYCCGRTDAIDQYHAIMDELERNGRSPRVVWAHDKPNAAPAADTPPEPAADADGCASCERLVTSYKRLAAQYNALQDERRAVLTVLSNEGLTTTERIAGVVTALHATENRKRADEHGAVPTFIPKVAERAGLPERTYSRTLKNLEAYGWAERRHEPVQAYDRATQTYTDRKVTQLRVILPGETVADALAPLAALKPERTRAGGARPRQCPKHPEADIYRRTTYHCAVCHDVIERELRVDEDTGEIFGDVKPEAGQNGSPPSEPEPEPDTEPAPEQEPEAPTQPPLMTDEDTSAPMGGQNGSHTTSGVDGHSDGPTPSPEATPDRCADCGKRPPIPYRRQCQPCILGALRRAS